MFKLTKKKVAAGLVAAGMLATTGIAYAYVTTDGTGTGSGSTGTSETLTLHGTAADALYPGTDTSVSFTVDNDSPGVQYVTTIKLDSVEADAGHADCDTDDYSMEDVTVGEEVPSGDGNVLLAEGTLKMANNGNQDDCKGATLTLNLSSE